MCTDFNFDLTIFRADIFDWIAVPQLFILAAVAQQGEHNVADNYLQSNTVNLQLLQPPLLSISD